MFEIPHTLTVEECILFSKYIDCDSIKEGDDAKQLAVQYRLRECIINRVLKKETFFSINPIKDRKSALDELPYVFCKTYPENSDGDSWEFFSHEYCFEPSYEEMVSYEYSYEELKLLSSLMGMWSTGAQALLENFEDEIDIAIEYLDFREDFDCDEWKNACKSLLKDIADASESGLTENDLLIDAAMEVSGLLYNGKVPYSDLIKNLDEYFSLCFCADGLWHDVLTISHDGIAKYLYVKDSIPESEIKSALDRTIKVLEQPLCFGFNCAETIVHKDKDVFAVTIPFGGMETSDGISVANLTPFFMTAMRMVDVLLPEVMKNVS